MKEQQLEFNIEDKSPSEIKFSYLEKQVIELSESLNKTRRSLFGKVGELQKSLFFLKAENNELKRKLYEDDPSYRKNQEPIWTYGENGFLFDIKTG